MQSPSVVSAEALGVAPEKYMGVKVAWEYMS